MNALYKNVDKSVDKVMAHITAVEMTKKKILKNRRRRHMKEAGFSMTGDNTEILDEEPSTCGCKYICEAYRTKRVG